jgi:imidazole glycerol-phosphate synthase subunit HisH
MSTGKIAIVDYGAGNLASVKKAFDYFGADAIITAQPKVAAKAEKIVLPGVGHFSTLNSLKTLGLRNALLDVVRAGKPLLGICLGMQWLFEGSDEDPECRGAGLFSGRCCAFPASVKSPHVGWNSLSVKNGSRLLQGIANGSFVYFTHSFCAPASNATTATTEHGVPFAAVVEQRNIFGVQFHPEKSSSAGLSILKNFCEIGSAKRVTC